MTEWEQRYFDEHGYGPPKIDHQEVAEVIEQFFDNATYSESEGPDTKRVDFEGRQSIWFSTYMSDGGQVSAHGTISKKLHKKMLNFFNIRWSGTIKTEDLRTL